MGLPGPWGVFPESDLPAPTGYAQGNAGPGLCTEEVSHVLLRGRDQPQTEPAPPHPGPWAVLCFSRLCGFSHAFLHLSPPPTGVKLGRVIKSSLETQSELGAPESYPCKAPQSPEGGEAAHLSARCPSLALLASQTRPLPFLAFSSAFSDPMSDQRSYKA